MSNMPKKTKTDRSSFSQAFQELQRITEAFEQETVDLDQALAKFERGLELARQLKSRLKEIENTVENLKAKFNDKA